MFQTESHALNPMMSAIAGKDQHVWSYVNLAIYRPWFYASYVLHTPEADVREAMMLSNVEQVADMVKRNKRTLDVESLMLVSPPSLNGSEIWLMEPLLRVWDGEMVKTGGYALIYDVGNGKRYVDSFETTDLSQIRNLRSKVRFGSRRK